MAVIRSVSVTTTPRLHGCISKAQESNSSRFKSFSAGPYKETSVSKPITLAKEIPILKMVGCNGIGLDYTGFGSSGRILGSCWTGFARRIPSAADSSGQRTAVEEEVAVMEGDVVEYQLDASGDGGQEDKDNGRQIGVGVIIDMINDSDGLLCQIEPLCQEDPSSKEWIHDESEPEIIVRIGQVRVLQAWYSQRMVPDRISNPHGEHAENLWILE